MPPGMMMSETTAAKSPPFSKASAAAASAASSTWANCSHRLMAVRLRTASLSSTSRIRHGAGVVRGSATSTFAAARVGTAVAGRLMLTMVPAVGALLISVVPPMFRAKP